MNLGRQIHTLLKRQSSVYVNRLGTFKRVHTPAAFDAKRHVYLPPITFVEFDSGSNDGYDFITYVQQANELDRNQAELNVNQAVAVVLEQLTQLGQARLDSLGDLVSYGNSYVFKPLDLSGFNYTAVSEQFHDEVAAPVEASNPDELRKQEAIVETPIQVVDEVPLEDAKPVATNSPVVPPSTDVSAVTAVDQGLTLDDPEFEIPAERKSTSAYVYALVAVLAVALLGGLYYYSTYMQDGSGIAENNEVVIVPMDSITTDTVSTVLPVDSLSSVEQDTLTAPLPEPEKSEEIETPANHRYTIVIGTHKTLAQAYDEAEAFNKDGHKSVRVITPNLAKNLKRVVWDTYAEKEERDSALRYVRKHIKADAWPDVIK
ncbi:hypothetical protein [Sphingobacterium paucimobilis]|uniref:CCDC81-like prokaryotic HU domain-containing protein n=1 Tax=Sphingobacterium paucimobilis HER1398 TaxID=1346330 RepID=U2J108_9SPHI|nr:hypothetical protein [Sphingobacterium paucimobilis]ERJ58629.1 hypothetical protein M472_07610 [Sphingobacterium paucimobilis HER1398]